MDDELTWCVTIDNARAVLDCARRADGATTEERVLLDDADRRLHRLQTMIRGRARAQELEALPCPVCRGLPYIGDESWTDMTRPEIVCETCGERLTSRDIGIREAVLSVRRYTAAEIALVGAWNSMERDEVEREYEDG